MSFLSSPASTSSYGLVEIGSGIFVTNDLSPGGAGVISIGQDVSTTTSVTFAGITDTGNLTVNGTFSLNSTAASISTTTGALVVRGGMGVGGSLYATNLYDSGNRVITSFTAVPGTGISGGGTITGSTGSFTFTNTGVLSLTAGPGITLSASTGNITVSSFGADLLNTVLTTASSYTVLATDEYIGVNSVVAVNIILPDAIPLSGRSYIIKDEHGQGSGKINLIGTAGQFPEASGNYIISVPYQSVTVVARGGLWHII